MKKEKLIMRKKAVTVATILMLLALVVPGVVAAGPRGLESVENGNAIVYVIHGIPGADLGLDPALPVDVLVNDAICLLEGFEFGEITPPQSLPAGTYNIKISLADPTDPCSGSPVIEADVPFAADESATVIAHLTEAGDPTASKFVNDVTPTGRGKARVAVRHTAAAGAVDVDVRRPLEPTPFLFIEDLTNPNEAQTEIRPGEWDVTIYPADDPNPVFGPVTVQFRPFTGFFVYAVGTPGTGTFTLIPHVIYGLHPVHRMPYGR
jgi:hypothetical protein